MRLALLAAVLFLIAVPAGVYAQDAGPRAKETYDRALDLEARGNYAAALPLLWEAAGLAPGDPDVQNRLGEALVRMGALDAAVDAFRRALAARPAFRKASNNLIMALVKTGKGEEAVDRARRQVLESPADPDSLFTLGLAQSEQDIDAAIITFHRTLAVAPRHVLARYNLALALQRADRQQDALDELQKALAIEPRPEMHYTRGVIYWHQGDLDRAAAALRAAIAAEPGYADAHYTLGAVLKARKDWAGAAESLRRAMALGPNQPAAQYALGQVLAQSGDEAGARANLAEAERLRRRVEIEREASVLTVVGSQRLEAGDLAGALDRFRQAAGVFDGYAPAHYQMGIALQRLHQPEAAQAAFARARQLNPALIPPPDAKPVK